MRKLVTLAVFSIVIGVVTSVVVQSQLLARVAFTASVSHRMYKDGGATILRNDGVIAVRSDGSIAETKEQLAPDSRQWEQRKIVDVTTKRETRLDNLTKSTTTMRISDQHAEAMRGKPTTCFQNRSRIEAGEVILGYETVQVERTVKMGPMTVRRTSWMAPDLDCFPLRENSYVSHGEHDSFRIVNSLEVLAISIGEPRADLFVIPEGYLERMPSEVLAEYGRMYPSEEYSPERLERYRSKDRPYLFNRP